MGPIARRFEAAASTYDRAAVIQRQVADALADDIAVEGLPVGGRVLELGCGTGLLTRRLLPHLQPGLWIASDIAPAMLQAARRGLDHPALAFARIDAAEPGVEPGFDLVCSGLTLQWLDDPAAVLGRWGALVRPGGVLGFSTLLKGSFGAWRSALAAAGAREPEPVLPTLAELQRWLGPDARIRVLDLVEQHADGLSFLKAARLAGVDGGLTRPLSAGTMRRAMKAFQAGGAAIRYHTAVVILRT
jgi:malonyl-CoA O-methyltransferase